LLKYQVDKSPVAIRYRRHGQHHRKNSPAYIENHGYIVWLEYDQQHRKDGPAIMFSDGKTVMYMIRGERINAKISSSNNSYSTHFI
jgi:hypothetical protein